MVIIMGNIKDLAVIVSALAITVGAGIGISDYNIARKIGEQEELIEEGYTHAAIPTSGSVSRAWRGAEQKIIADARSKIKQYEDQLIVYRN